MKNSLTYKKYSRVNKYDLNFLYVKKIQQDSKFCFLDPDCFWVDFFKSPKWCNLGNPQDKIHFWFFSNRSCIYATVLIHLQIVYCSMFHFLGHFVWLSMSSHKKDSSFFFIKKPFWVWHFNSQYTHIRYILLLCSSIHVFSLVSTIFLNT